MRMTPMQTFNASGDYETIKVIKFKIQLLCLLPEIRLVDKDDNSYYHIIIINIDDMGLLVCDKGRVAQWV